MNVLQDILDERARQDARWGEQNHHPFRWIAILTEEVGEASQAALNFDWHSDQANANAYRAELVQVAAVAYAMLEAHDRGRA